MKKLTKIIFLLFGILFLTSCGEKYNYQLTEMNGQDFLANLKANNNMVFAFLTADDEQNRKFMSDLQSLVNKKHLNIYYIDLNHMDSSSIFYLYDNYPFDYDNPSYYVLDNKEFAVSATYTNYQDLYTNLKNYTFINDLIITPEEELEKNLALAKEEYEKGNIGIAKDYLDLSWTLPESKIFYKDNKYFSLLDSWERYEFTDVEKLNYTTYQVLIFTSHNNYYVEAKKSGEYENFEKPQDISDYKNVYYYLKDDIIYTIDKKDKSPEEYKPTYQIIDITSQLLTLKDLKNNKEYEYLRGA